MKNFQNGDTMKKEIIIANPIYDVVFKNLMTTETGTNKDIASYFFGTILGEEITDINFLPQEYTYKKTKPKKQGLSSIRLDFVTTIRTKTGDYKKVLIEIQKTQRPMDLIRFRTYIGQQYQQHDMIELKDNKIEKALPLVIIYMLGFELSGINTVVVSANRLYFDMMKKDPQTGKNAIIETRHPFIESLTHDGFFIQIPRINKGLFTEWKNCSDYYKILSLFEQDYFIDNESKTIKTYPYSLTDKNLKKMVNTLEYIASDNEIRRIMLEEYWAEQDEILWKQSSAEKDKTIAVLSKNNKAKDNTIAAKDNTIAAKDKEIIELRQILLKSGIDIPSA